MGESRLIVDELLALCLQRITMEERSLDTDIALEDMVKNMEACRKKWLHAELELKKYKELLVKSDVAKAALEVKLKHARNQLDVEMKKRYKMEGDYQYLQRQMQLMCDILVHDSKSSACLNDEQKSLLAAFEQKGTNVTQYRTSKRLSAIDESSFLSHSDISYDRTEDDVDLDTTVIKPLRSRARERRRSSMGLAVSVPAGRRGRGGTVPVDLLEGKTIEKEVQTVVKASVPESSTGTRLLVEIPPDNLPDANPDPTGTGTQEECGSVSGDPESQPDAKIQLCQAKKILKHDFVSKTVIRPEACSLCTKRIRFGKMVVRCRTCRFAIHPECKHRVTDGCSTAPTGSAPMQYAHQVPLEVFLPLNRPRIPQLIIECVAEIENRGLTERGLYRVPGGERQVKELRERFAGGKSSLQLGKVSDVHVVCGVLKDFLRRLKEPLVTFRLHRTFMEASEICDERSATAAMFQAIAELPSANRDTLAFLMLHFHRVMRSPQCQMDQNNLSRVFGPTLVGHGMPDPSPNTIMRDTHTQPKVMSHLLSLPEEYWRRVLTIHPGQSSSSSQSKSQDQGHARLFKPLTSPELNIYSAAPSRGSLRGRIRNLGNVMCNTGRIEPVRRFFTSPS